MMNKYVIKHPLLKKIEFEASSFLQIIGLNNKVKEKIKQVMQWNLKGHKYSDIQLMSLNDNELEFHINDKKVKKQDYHYIYISSKHDLIFQLSSKKDSITLDYLNAMTCSQGINLYVSKINELLDLISIEYNKINIDNNINLEYLMKEIVLKDINQEFFETLLLNYDNACFDFCDNEKLLEEVYNILVYMLNNTDKKYFIILDNLSHFLGKQQIDKFLGHLKKLTNERLLTVVNFGYSKNDAFYEKDLIDSTIVCGDIIEKLDDWDTIYNYIKRNYPSNLKLSEDELFKYISEVIAYLFAEDGIDFVNTYKRQIIYVLLNKAYRFNVNKGKNIENVDDLEMSYLIDNLYNEQ